MFEEINLKGKQGESCTDHLGRRTDTGSGQCVCTWMNLNIEQRTQ